MAGLPRFDFNAVDWLATTMGLSPGAKGLFTDVLARTHDQGAPVQVASLPKITGIHWRALRKLLNELVEAGRIRVEDGLVYNDRALRESAINQAKEKTRLLSAAVLERDGHACVYCGATEKLTVDHVRPSSRGGPTTMENLVAACRKCNTSKGARTVEEWRGSSAMQ